MSAPPRAGPRGTRGLGLPIVAVLQKRGRFYAAEPLFERRGRLAIESRARGDGAPGDLVLLGSGKRGLRVSRVLGRPDIARDVVEGLMYDRGLRRAFPRSVEREAAEVAAEPPVEGPRRDLTDLPTLTIDPETARDYDDAVSAERLEGDRVRLWIHIADVSAFVRPGGELDAEAYRRGTSTYVPGAVEPMLPEALSSDACSLLPGTPRPCVTVEVELEGATPRSVSLYRSTIRSDARLTYTQVDRTFAGAEAAEEPWAATLETARAAAAALTARRDERGSLEVQSQEPQFGFDEHGNVVGVRHEEQTEAHRLIEELMILANERVAEYLADRRAPTLYRVHERPDPQAVEFMVKQLASLEVPTPALPKHMSPQQAGDVAAEASRLVAEHVRRTGRGRGALGSLVLRSLKQAYYSPRNVGHAGLASPRYSHFTSPIRRYPDLVAHRALLGALGLDDAAPRGPELDEAGIETSASERRAMEIERQADDVVMAFLLERVLSESRGEEVAFEGEIVGVIGAGAFVRFGEQGFEGFLPVRRLRGDWWELNEEGTALLAEGSGRALRLGDPIAVTVDRVEAPRGRVDLLPAPS